MDGNDSKPFYERMAQDYRSMLLDNVLPFWMNHSHDEEHGGYFTCLDKEGKVFDDDKYVWLQARQVWVYSMLYNSFEPRQEWLDAARLGAEFLMNHGMDNEGNWYFSLTRDGTPLSQPHSIFSDCFAAMAFSQYYFASDDLRVKKIAEDTYMNILRRKESPKGTFNKRFPGTRPMLNLALPMILANLASEMGLLVDEDLCKSTEDMCIDEVMNVFLDRDRNLLFENAFPDGAKNLGNMEGRLITPGHGIEAMWFLMDIAEKRKDDDLANKCVDIVLSSLDFGWDSEFGGIYYFMDSEGRPPEKLEWDQKLWWVHLETLVALAKGYRLTGRAECMEWFRKVHDYAWSHFVDHEHGEWFGYLNRRGERLLELKGGKWKGCFHVPRGAFLCYREFSKLLGK